MVSYPPVYASRVPLLMFFVWLLLLLLLLLLLSRLAGTQEDRHQAGLRILHRTTVAGNVPDPHSVLLLGG